MRPTTREDSSKFELNIYLSAIDTPSTFFFSTDSYYSKLPERKLELLCLSRFCENSAFSVLPYEVILLIQELFVTQNAFLLRSTINFYFQRFEEKYVTETERHLIKSVRKAILKLNDWNETTLAIANELKLYTGPIYNCICQLYIQFRTWLDGIFIEENNSNFLNLWREDSLNKMIDIFQLFYVIDQKLNFDDTKFAYQIILRKLLFSNTLNTFICSEKKEEKYD